MSLPTWWECMTCGTRRSLALDRPIETVGDVAEAAKAAGWEILLRVDSPDILPLAYSVRCRDCVRERGSK